MTDTNPSPPPQARPGGGPVPWMISLALAAVVGAVLFAGGYLAGGGAGSSDCAAPDDAFAAFCEAYERIQTEYVDDLDPSVLAEGAIRGMFQYGVQDPYSGYMPPEQYQQALGDLSGSFSGIGAEMAVKNLDEPENLEACDQFTESCVLVVVAPLAGTPAEAAGLESGDVVAAVDGEPVAGSTMQDQISKIRGEKGTDVTLTVVRDGGEPFDITITRDEITIREVVTRMIDGHIGYIDLNGFSEPAPQQFKAGLQELLDQGADQFVLDLRDNPGGYIDAAQAIASQFIESGVIFTQESAGDDTRVWEATGDGLATDEDYELAVLVNGGSASASEIVAAALKERDRATLIGEPTFGKNTVQVWGRLENDGGVRITISRWFTPEHNSVAPDGIQPEIDATRTAATPPEEDPVLEAALSYLGQQPVADEVGSPEPSGSPSALLTDPLVVGVVGSRAIC